LKRGGVGIAQWASVAALKFGVVVQRSTLVQCFLSPAIDMHSFAAAQPTFDLCSFVDHSSFVVVEVQWIGTAIAVAAICIHRCQGYNGLVSGSTQNTATRSKYPKQQVQKLVTPSIPNS